MKKTKESLKSLLKDQIEKQDRAIQEVRDRQSRDMDEVRSMLNKLRSVIGSQSSSTNASIVKSGREYECNRGVQSKFTSLEFPKFNRE